MSTIQEIFRPANNYEVFTNFLKMDYLQLMKQNTTTYKVIVDSFRLFDITRYLIKNDIQIYGLVLETIKKVSFTVSFLDIHIPIPQNKPFYVVATDKILSGWGKAEGLTNIVCVPCETKEQAKNIKEYMESRQELEGTLIFDEYPTFYKHQLVSNLSDWLMRF